jgi:hypothetical protein
LPEDSCKKAYDRCHAKLAPCSAADSPSLLILRVDAGHLPATTI